MRAILLLHLALLSSTVFGEQLDLRLLLKVPHAIAVDGLPDFGYYVLNSNGVIYRYKAAGGGLQFSNRFAMQLPGEALDLTFVHDDSQDSVIVTQWVESLSQGSIYRYTPEGKVIRVWKTRHMPGGAHFDPLGRQLYYGTIDSNELYSVDLNGGDSKLLCNIRGAVRLGPVTGDANRRLLYAADGEGKLFVVDLGSKKVVQLSPSFALVSALLFDDKSRLLYVADPVQKKIYVVDPSTQSSRPIAESAQMTNPSGLALGPENSLLVSDEKSGGIFLIRLGLSPQVNISPRKPSRSRDHLR